VSVPDKVWDTLKNSIKMNEKIVSLAGTVKEQQAKIEALTKDVVRLETRLEVLTRATEEKGGGD
jgi:hypothetical protein